MSSTMSSRSMTAVLQDRYGSPDVLRIGEVPVAEPGDGEVLVKVQASALNTADLDHLRGRPPAARVATGLRTPRWPATGLDVAGRVDAVGPGVQRLRPGDQVWADLSEHGRGAFAEYVCRAEDAFAPRPDDVAADVAATIPHSAVLAWQAIHARGPIEPGDQVLVNGAGGCVGPFAIQLARSYGAEVTGVDAPAKLDLVRSVGAHHVIDHTREDVTRNGRRYDLIIDIAATRSLLPFRRCLRPGGGYALIARSLAGFVGALLLGPLVSRRDGTRLGVFPWKPSDARALASLGGLLASGDLRPVILDRIGLDEVPDALRRMEAGEAQGRFVVVP